MFACGSATEIFKYEETTLDRKKQIVDNEVML
jgi:hypothetical protein